MKIASRNVNGIRAILSKGFFDRIKIITPDIICLQEVKALATQIPPELRFFLPDYEYMWHQGTKPGYAGTAILYRKEGVLITTPPPHNPPVSLHSTAPLTGGKNEIP